MRISVHLLAIGLLITSELQSSMTCLAEDVSWKTPTKVTRTEVPFKQQALTAYPLTTFRRLKDALAARLIAQLHPTRVHEKGHEVTARFLGLPIKVVVSQGLYPRVELDGQRPLESAYRRLLEGAMIEVPRTRLAIYLGERVLVAIAGPAASLAASVLAYVVSTMLRPRAEFRRALAEIAIANGRATQAFTKRSGDWRQVENSILATVNLFGLGIRWPQAVSHVFDFPADPYKVRKRLAELEERTSYWDSDDDEGDSYPVRTSFTGLGGEALASMAADQETFERLFRRFSSFCVAYATNGSRSWTRGSLGQAFELIVEAAQGREWVVMETMELMIEVSKKGQDPSLVLHAILPTVVRLAGDGQDDFKGIISVVRKALDDRCNEAWWTSASVAAAEFSGGDAVAYKELLEALLAQDAVIKAHYAGDSFYKQVLPTLVKLARSRKEIFLNLNSTVLRTASEIHRQEHGGVGEFYRFAVPAVETMAGDRDAVFAHAIETLGNAMAELQPTADVRPLLVHTIPALVGVVQTDGNEFELILKEVISLIGVAPRDKRRSWCYGLLHDQVPALAKSVGHEAWLLRDLLEILGGVKAGRYPRNFADHFKAPIPAVLAGIAQGSSDTGHQVFRQFRDLLMMSVYGNEVEASVHFSRAIAYAVALAFLTHGDEFHEPLRHLNQAGLLPDVAFNRLITQQAEKRGWVGWTYRNILWTSYGLDELAPSEVKKLGLRCPDGEGSPIPTRTRLAFHGRAKPDPWGFTKARLETNIASQELQVFLPGQAHYLRERKKGFPSGRYIFPLGISEHSGKVFYVTRWGEYLSGCTMGGKFAQEFRAFQERARRQLAGMGVSEKVIGTVQKMLRDQLFNSPDDQSIPVTIADGKLLWDVLFLKSVSTNTGWPEAKVADRVEMIFWLTLDEKEAFRIRYIQQHGEGISGHGPGLTLRRNEVAQKWRELAIEQLTAGEDEVFNQSSTEVVLTIDQATTKTLEITRPVEEEKVSAANFFELLTLLETNGLVPEVEQRNTQRLAETAFTMKLLAAIRAGHLDVWVTSHDENGTTRIERWGDLEAPFPPDARIFIRDRSEVMSTTAGEGITGGRIPDAQASIALKRAA
jgi:hypothetical protein